MISVFSVVFCFVMTCMFGIPKEVLVSDSGETKLEGDFEGEEIASPVTGQMIALESVNDPTFSRKLLGDGFAVIPSDGIIKAPADGRIEVAYETGHAIGMTTVLGTELLIHVGIDTVSLNGEGFERLVSEGQEVKKGDPLLRVDLKTLARREKDPTVLVIFTGGETFMGTQYDQTFTACGKIACIVGN